VTKRELERRVKRLEGLIGHVLGSDVALSVNAIGKNYWEARVFSSRVTVAARAPFKDDAMEQLESILKAMEFGGFDLRFGP